jgi:hypothetical protein
LVFANQLHKQQCFDKEYHMASSMAEWSSSSSESFRLDLKLEKAPFCWIGCDCARDNFKHSEPK